MGELYEPFPKLPKNIRQIGERDKVLKLYVEDYVNTYLKRLRPAKGADLRVGLLLGSRETREDMPYVFIDGAVEMEAVAQEGEKVVFTDEAWKKAYQEVEQIFPKRTVQGWFLCGNPGCTLSPLNYWRQHSQYFTGKNQLMYLSCGLEGEEAVYITSADGFYKLQGYSVYYERNQMMQDYMVLRKDVPRAEDGADDKVIQDFRQRMEEKRYEAGRRRSTVGVLSGLCTALTITVMAGGVAMFNNYQKLHQMEAVIASVLPDGGGELTYNSSGKGWTSTASPDYTIEEVAGNVSPTTAPDPSADKEQPSVIQPETMPPTGTRDPEPSSSSSTSDAGSSKAEKTSTAETDTEETDTVETGAAPTQTETALAAEATSSAHPSQGTPQDKPAGSSDTYQVYTVGDGESLYGICYKLYQNLSHAQEICQINGLSDANSIYSGQKLLVP